MLDNRAANRLDDLLIIGIRGIAGRADAPRQAARRAIAGQREGRARQHGRMGLFGRLLDVLRIVVAAANDDHVFHAAGDKQLAFAEETQDRRFARTCLRGPAPCAPKTCSVSSARFQ